MRTENNYIRTYSGRKFWPLDPRPEDVDIIDIAHALSNQCRFTGHVKDFYSVAEHSLAVSFECPKHLALIGLLHDADEAYLVDLPSPVKHDPRLAAFVEISEGVQRAVFTAFGLDVELIPQIKPWDKADYERERNYLMPTGSGYGMFTMTPKESERNFLERYYRLNTSIESRDHKSQGFTRTPKDLLHESPCSSNCACSPGNDGRGEEIRAVQLES